MEPGRQISGGFFCVHTDSSSGQQVRVSQTGRGVLGGQPW